MSDSTVKLFGSHEIKSENYHRMVTRLGEVFTESGEDTDKIGGYSLFKDLEDVKERYQNPLLIGEGGMKRIYQVFDRMTDREVALAIIHNLAGVQLIEQFIVEARITARLEHPNIMPIYDFGLDEKGEPFFTMKLIRGENLGKIISRLKSGDRDYGKKYPLEALLEIFVKICDAVAYAHHNGVLHLDLKPDNVQVGNFGEVLVCDWGISRYHETVQSEVESAQSVKGILTVHGKVNGSPGYMSPEQIMIPRNKLTVSSDIYSLGAILYEILTHELPIRITSAKEMMEDTISHRIIPMSKSAPGKIIPSSLGAVCLKAMSLEASVRYGHAEELKNEILAFRGGFATTAENAGFFKNLFFLATRHKALCGTISIAIGLIVAIAAWSLISINAQKNEVEKQYKELMKKNEELTEIKKTEVAPQRQEKAEKLYNDFNFQDAYKFLTEAIRFDPENINLHKFMGLMNLGERKFREAKENLTQANNPELQKYISFCEEMIKLNVPENKRLPEDKALQLAKLLHEDGNDSALGQFLINEAEKITDIQEKLQFSYQLLGILNPLEGKINMDCCVSKDNSKVSISLEGNPNLTDINGLVILPVSSLNLKETKVSNLNPLRRQPLDNLNLSGTLTNDLEPVSGSSLKSLDISSTKVLSLKGLNFPKLEKITLKKLELKDLKTLKTFPSLKVIEISNTPFSQRSVKEAALPDTMKVNFENE